MCFVVLLVVVRIGQLGFLFFESAILPSTCSPMFRLIGPGLPMRRAFKMQLHNKLLRASVLVPALPLPQMAATYERHMYIEVLPITFGLMVQRIAFRALQGLCPSHPPLSDDEEITRVF